MQLPEQIFAFKVSEGRLSLLMPVPLPFCWAVESCLGLSRVVEFLLPVSPVLGLTRGRVAIPLLWTWCPLWWPLLTPLLTPLVPLLTAAATELTEPLLTMLPLMLMLSQLSLVVWCPVPVTPLNRVPGPISFDFRGGKCCKIVSQSTICFYETTLLSVTDVFASHLTK